MIPRDAIQAQSFDRSAPGIQSRNGFSTRKRTFSAGQNLGKSPTALPKLDCSRHWKERVHCRSDLGEKALSILKAANVPGSFDDSLTGLLNYPPLQ